MGVIVIGNRAVGKTSMVMSLADGTRHVSIVNPDPESLRARRFNQGTGEVVGTSKVEEETLSVNVILPGGERQIQVRWIDTPGEAFSDRDWKNRFPEAWQDLENEISQSLGIILLLPPHRNLVQLQLLEEFDDTQSLDEFQTSSQWANMFKNWLNFLSKNCTRGQHVLVCLHKADLFCNFEEEGRKWRFDNSKSRLWFEYDNYIRHTYFSNINSIIREFKESHKRSSAIPSIRFFITTVRKESLLELPWLYLGAYIANM